MSKKAQLTAKRVEAVNAASAIRSKSKAESRDMTDVEYTEFKSHVDSAEALQAQISQVEAQERTIAGFDNQVADLSAPAGRRSAPNDVALSTEHRDMTLEDPAKGFKSPRDFMNSMVTTFAQRKITDKRLKPLASSDKGLLFFKRDENGKLVSTAGSDEQAVFSDPNGGFLVPEQFSPTLLQVDPEEDVIGSRTTRLPMQSPVVKIPARVDKNHTTSVAGGFTVSRRPESVAGSTSQGSYAQVQLEAASLFGGAYVTEELLMDSPLSFAAILAKGFQQQFVYFLINERLNGTGTGEFQGINNCPCLVSVAKETGQAAKTVVYQNVLKMRARSWMFSKAIWYANHDVYPTLAQMSLAVGTGGVAVYQPSAVEGRPDMLLGRPIYYGEYPNTCGTAGDLILGVWDEYLEGIYQPLQSAESIHVRFLNNERTFKFWMRNAGAPWWASALTPKQGAGTLSPFVVLATRA